mmetsp:Transcript_22734/g.21930  ORF Transcript_22734/g.21930 Transcript_22734/m.21930 type:complete len:83 (-) Transcript_22734:492-740(-)
MSSEVLIGIIPGFDEPVSDGQGSSLVSAEVVEIEPGEPKSVLYVVHDRPLDRPLIRSLVRTHQFPKLLLPLLLLVVLKLRLK